MIGSQPIQITTVVFGSHISIMEFLEGVVMILPMENGIVIIYGVFGNHISNMEFLEGVVMVLPMENGIVISMM